MGICLLHLSEEQVGDNKRVIRIRGGSRISSWGGGGGGGHLKKLRRAEGGANIFWVFRVKNHDFAPKNHIFTNCGGRREHCWGISCEKSRFYAKIFFFSNFRGGGRAGCPPPPPPPPPLDPPLRIPKSNDSQHNGHKKEDKRTNNDQQNTTHET